MEKLKVKYHEFYEYDPKKNRFICDHCKAELKTAAGIYLHLRRHLEKDSGLVRPGAPKKTYTFWSDSGHAWLEVNRHELETLKITDQISGYSYRDAYGKVYLEEDCDAGVFIKAAGIGRDQIREIYRDNLFIRNLDHFNAGSAA